MRPNLKLTLLCLSFMMLGLFALPAMAQPSISKTFSPSTIGPGSTSTITFTITNGSGLPVMDLAFTDTLPVVPGAMTIASPAMASTTCMDATLTASEGGGAITLSGGRLGGFQTCFVTVNVTASTPGVYTNPAVTLSSSAGSSMSLPANLTVDVNRPSFSKSFSPSSVDLGEVSTLTFTIDNTLNANRVGSLGFTDNLPAGLEIANPSNASTDCISASAPNTTLTAEPGSSQIILAASGANFLPGFEVLPIGATCSVTVDVVTTGTGQMDNLTENLSADFSIAGKATDALEVLREDPIHIQKSFTNDPVVPGGTVELEFLITNFDRLNSASNINFSDTLTTAVAGLTFTNELENTCGGSLSGLGTSAMGLTGGSLSSGGSCTIRIECTLDPGITPGVYTNTTTAINATIDGMMESGNPASGKLFVAFAPTFTKEFLEVGTLNPDPVVGPGDDVVLRFTIENTDSSNMLTDIAFTDELTFPGMGLPFPLQVVLPPAPTCGAGSTLGLFSPDTDRQGLQLTGGSLAAAGSCSFDVTITIPSDQAGGILTNTTSEVTGTLNGSTVTGEPASDDLEILFAPNLSKSFSAEVVQPGEQVDVTFTLSLAEDASAGLTNVSFSDDLGQASFSGASATIANPNNLNDDCSATVTAVSGSNTISVSGVDLMPGESCSITVTLDISAGASTGSYTNTTSAVTAMSNGQTVTGLAAEADLLVTNISFTKEFIYTNDPALPGDVVTMRLKLDNTMGTTDATVLNIDDSFDFLPGTTVTLPPLVNDCGATITFSSNNLNVDNFTATAGNSCTVDVEVNIPTNAATGSYLNTASSPFVILGGSAIIQLPAASDTLNVDADLLSFSKEFTNDPVLPGDPVDLKFTLNNLNSSETITAITFTDDLETLIPGVILNGLPMNVCGGTVDETAPDSGILELTGASLAPGAMCTFTVNLTIPDTVSSSNYENTTSAVTGTVTTGAGAVNVFGPPATDVLRVRTLFLEKSFAPGAVDAADSKMLTFTLTNLDASNNVTAINFIDDLNAFIPGATVDSLPADLSSCGESANVSGMGTGTFSFMQGDLDPSGSCSFSINVKIPCSADGNYVNTTSAVSASGFEGSFSAPEDTASLNVIGAGPATFDTPSDITIYMDSNCNFDASPSLTGEPTNIMHECCMMGFTYTPTDDSTMLNQCNGTGVIKRTWTVTDCNGVTSPSGPVQTITVLDTIIPTVSCPVTATVDCDGDMTPTATGTATGGDNCDSNPMITYSDSDNQTSNGTCSDHQYTITRTWKATDACGNESMTCAQTINVVDTIIPTVSCPVTATVDCDGDMTPTATGTATGGDNCDTNPMITYSDSDNQTSNGTCSDHQYTITRTWKATDICGNESITCSQTINVVDTIIPTVSCPVTATVDCDGDMTPTATGTATGGDNCDSNPMITYSDSDNQTSNGTCSDHQYTITRTWKATDACGNESMTCSQTINVVDTIIPTVSCPVTATVDCDGDMTPTATGTATGMDNCDSNPMITYSDSDNQTSNGTCSDHQYTITRTWKATDICGNESMTCAQTINVVDTIIPTVSCPVTATVDCNGDMTPTATGTATGGDNCDPSPVITYSDSDNQTSDGTCSDHQYTITRTWKATDICGNESMTCSQTINVVDTIIPTVSCPVTVTVECDGDMTPAATGMATGMDNCDPSPMITYSDSDNQTSNGTCTDHEYTITRTWKATDACGNESTTCTQTINVVDSQGPAPACNSFTVTLSPTGDASITIAEVFNVGSSTDNCSATITALSLSKEDFNCDDVGPNSVTLTTEDVCGNQGTCVATVTVVDDIPPTATCQPVTYTLDSSGTQVIVPVDLFASGMDNCGIVNPQSVNPPNLTCDNLGASDVTLTVSDGSGNTATCMTTVTILAGPYFTWYKDTDNDGYSSGDIIEGCTAPSNYKLVFDLTTTSGDCNDNDPFVHPDRFEICNSIDDDCDGMIDENVVTGISIANMSTCNDNGTSDPADDTFTADVTVTFDDIAPLGNLSLSGDATASVAVGSLSGSSYTFMGVSMTADNSTISLSASFTLSGCVFSNTNAGTAPANCSPCEITGISVDNFGVCNPNGNTDPTDDTFTGDVTVSFFNAPATGTLDLTGDGTASVDVTSLVGNSHIFTGVQLPADGEAIELTASFSNEGSCSLTEPNAGTALDPCCTVEITDVDAEAESCIGFADGAIEISAEGTGTLIYSIDGGISWQTSNSFTNLSPGSYNIVVRVQGLSCTATSAASVPTGPIPTLWWKDSDGDGYTTGVTILSCEQPIGYVQTALLGDCNDNDANEFPGQTWYEDVDADGYSTGDSLVACSRPLNYFTSAELAATSIDCDDNDPAINPGATEVCNGIDDNCDGMIDDGVGGGLTHLGNVVFSNQQDVDDFSQCYSVIDGNLIIQNSGVNDLSNLIYLEEVTGNVDIKATSLVDLAGLDSLDTIGGYLRIRLNNNTLTSLDGLDGVTSVGGNLNVYFNNSLTDCCAIFELMDSGGVGGSITIFRNETGCDNYSQVEDDCDTNFSPGNPSSGGVISVPGGLTSDVLEIEVFPNPNGGNFEIRLENPIGSGQLAIMDAAGRIIWEIETIEGQSQYTPDLDGKLLPGLYLVLLSNGYDMIYENVIVE